MFSKREGFTIIELLLVILLISLVVSLIAPKAYKIYKKLNSRIETRQKIMKEKQVEFNNFIKGKYHVKCEESPNTD